MGRLATRPAPLRLTKKLTRSLREGHPWVFRDAVEGGEKLADGAIVELRAGDGKPVAVGFWDTTSAIAVRVLAAGRLPDPVGAVRVRLADALARRLARIDQARTTAFRWAHGEADRLPGVHVDLYGNAAVVRFDGTGARAFYAGIGGWLAESVPLRSAVDRQTGETLFGRPSGAIVEVLENGLRFEVAPAVGGKGGLFLDQRENREEVRKRSAGRTVLDLFSSTGAFSVYAAAGGATATETVDAARPAVAAARRNFERNGLSVDRARFHVGDAFDFLEGAAREGRRWDVVVSDPPSFAPRKSAVEGARRAYGRLHRLAAAVTARGGLLCAASCSSHFGREEFLASVAAGVRAARRRLVVEEVRGPGFDHPSLKSFPEGDYLKFALCRLP